MRVLVNFINEDCLSKYDEMVLEINKAFYCDKDGLDCLMMHGADMYNVRETFSEFSS